MTLQNPGRLWWLVGGLFAVATLGTVAWPFLQPKADGKPIARAETAIGKLPLYFVENRGQTDARVRYSLLSGRGAVHFTEEGVILALPASASVHEASSAPGIRQVSQSVDAEPHHVFTMRIDFAGARAGAALEAEGETEAIVSYFRGGRDEWKTGLRTYSSLVYRNVWPGIDLAYAGAEGRLKYTFHVAPGADPNRIRLAYRGPNMVRAGDAGELLVETPAGRLVEDRPYTYQSMGSERLEVPSAYSVAAIPSDGSWEIGFDVGSYDRTRPLVIDPAMLAYAGFIGGDGSEKGFAIAVDAAGNAYVTGETQSTETTFPDGAGPDLSANGDTDAFVAKVNADGTGLVYAGFLGGARSDSGRGIAVDAAGNAYVTGSTSSNEAADGFPVLVGPDLTYNTTVNPFVAKVNPEGTALIYAGYVGGIGFGNAIAVDGAGRAYLTGSTNDAGFVVVGGPDLTINGPDAFVARVTASGDTLEYSGYIGGDASDTGYGIAVDELGNAYVAGRTGSSTGFPATGGPDVTYNGGTYDGFIAKVNAAGTGFVYLGFVGGSAEDVAAAIAVDRVGSAYLAGYTYSTEGTFPAIIGPDLTQNGDADVFVAKVDPSGVGLTYSGFIGGRSSELGSGIAIDLAGNAYVTGTGGFDGTPAPQNVDPSLAPAGQFPGGALVAKVRAGGTATDYLGFVESAVGTGIAVDAGGNAYVTGEVSYRDFPANVGPDVTFNGGPRDAFVAKIASIFCKGKPATIAGSRAAESLLGTAGPDVINGLAGNDLIEGAGGSDTICGGRGSDTLRGMRGPDLLAGGGGADLLLGGRGDDQLRGGGGDDLLNGGGGIDDCTGGFGSNSLEGCEP